MTPTTATSPALVKLLSSSGIDFMTDGGLETTLLFLHGIDLPDFAAFPLLDDARGRDALAAYYGPYLDIAEVKGLGIVLDTPTWRANPDWGRRRGCDESALRAVNQRAVGFVGDLAAGRRLLDVVIDGVIGPRGDGYVVGEAMGAIEAATYHSVQIEALAEAGADMVTAVTMTYVEEAIGIATAAAAVGLPVALGFTVEVDGRLPSGQSLRSAIEAVDATTGGAPRWYMINCAHPSHFEHVLDDSSSNWQRRIRAIRANASRMSHAELDEAPELDRGDPEELAQDYRRLQQALPGLAVIGGCCGTDHAHLDALTSAVA